ncbi:protein argonaute-3-like isoform X1 [Homarus americanus]|uniref:protein argonaute-3-like isoform X1 n=1 Tax=Homarus americanus TaxID=6706 RepID=UPI001C47CE01|nr:protein argonaute-3-like isoform X1 [Homarus americanus]
MVEVMFRHYRAIKYELVGRRNFYSAGGEFGTPYPIGCGKEGVTGFFGSMRPASWKDGSLLLNIDVAHTAFYKEQPLLNFIQDFMNFREDDFHRPLEPFKQSKLLQELRNIRVSAVLCILEANTVVPWLTNTIRSRGSFVNRKFR